MWLLRAKRSSRRTSWPPNSPQTTSLSQDHFAPTETFQDSIYLTRSSHIEPRRISALLVRDEAVVDEQNIAVGADEKRQEFDFRFAKTPRPLGAYQIKFVEIARSNGKPMLLARLFLSVE